VGSSSLPIARNGCRNRDIAYANCWSFICHLYSQRSDNMAKKLIPFDDTDINRSGFDLSTET